MIKKGGVNHLKKSRTPFLRNQNNQQNQQEKKIKKKNQQIKKNHVRIFFE